MDDEVARIRDWDKKRKKKTRGKDINQWWDSELDSIFTNFSPDTIKIYEKIKKFEKNQNKKKKKPRNKKKSKTAKKK